MNSCKYIAAGFVNDAEKLFNDFAQCPNNDFETFCNVWKKHKFGCIFMGRSDKKELREFTGEIYQLTLNYMRSSSLQSQIAAIYLLYALYRNQDLISPVKIRISKLQFSIIQRIHAYAIDEKVHTLHYIIDYLKKNCLEFVANCTLYGPCCSLNRENPMKSKADEFAILSDLKQDMTIFQEKNFVESLKELRCQYLDRKNRIMPTSAAVKENNSKVINDYDDKIKGLKDILGRKRDKLVCTEKENSSLNEVSKESESAVEKNDIGQRRFELKAAASKMRVMPSKTRYLEDSVQEIESNEEPKPEVEEKISLIKKRSYNKRIPVRERKLGRPRKYAEKQVVTDESEDSDFQYSFQIQHNNVNNGKRNYTRRKKASYLINYDGPVILSSKQEPANDYREISDDSIDDELEF